eukprot:403338500
MQFSASQHQLGNNTIQPQHQNDQEEFFAVQQSKNQQINQSPYKRYVQNSNSKASKSPRIGNRSPEANRNLVAKSQLQNNINVQNDKNYQSNRITLSKNPSIQQLRQTQDIKLIQNFEEQELSFVSFGDNNQKSRKQSFKQDSLEEGSNQTEDMNFDEQNNLNKAQKHINIEFNNKALAYTPQIQLLHSHNLNNRVLPHKQEISQTFLGGQNGSENNLAFYLQSKQSSSFQYDLNDSNQPYIMKNQQFQITQMHSSFDSKESVVNDSTFKIPGIKIFNQDSTLSTPQVELMTPQQHKPDSNYYKLSSNQGSTLEIENHKKDSIQIENTQIAFNIPPSRQVINFNSGSFAPISQDYYQDTQQVQLEKSFEEHQEIDLKNPNQNLLTQQYVPHLTSQSNFKNYLKEQIPTEEEAFAYSCMQYMSAPQPMSRPQLPETFSYKNLDDHSQDLECNNINIDLSQYTLQDQSQHQFSDNEYQIYLKQSQVTQVIIEEPISLSETKVVERPVMFKSAEKTKQKFLDNSNRSKTPNKSFANKSGGKSSQKIIEAQYQSNQSNYYSTSSVMESESKYGKAAMNKFEDNLRKSMSLRQSQNNSRSSSILGDIIVKQQTVKPIGDQKVGISKKMFPIRKSAEKRQSLQSSRVSSRIAQDSEYSTQNIDNQKTIGKDFQKFLSTPFNQQNYNEASNVQKGNKVGDQVVLRQNLIKRLQEFSSQALIDLIKIKKPTKQALIALQSIILLLEIQNHKQPDEKINQDWEKLVTIISSNPQRISNEIQQITSKIASFSNSQTLDYLTKFCQENSKIIHQSQDRNSKIIFGVLLSVLEFITFKTQQLARNSDINSTPRSTILSQATSRKSSKVNDTKSPLRASLKLQDDGNALRSNKRYSMLNSYNPSPRIMFGTAAIGSVVNPSMSLLNATLIKSQHKQILDKEKIKLEQLQKRAGNNQSYQSNLASSLSQVFPNQNKDEYNSIRNSGINSNEKTVQDNGKIVFRKKNTPSSNCEGDQPNKYKQYNLDQHKSQIKESLKKRMSCNVSSARNSSRLSNKSRDEDYVMTERKSHIALADTPLSSRNQASASNNYQVNKLLKKLKKNRKSSVQDGTIQSTRSIDSVASYGVPQETPQNTQKHNFIPTRAIKIFKNDQTTVSNENSQKKEVQQENQQKQQNQEKVQERSFYEPENIMSILRQDLLGKIQQTAIEIEKNMQVSEKQTSKVDLGLIEEIKRRRLEQKLQLSIIKVE